MHKSNNLQWQFLKNPHIPIAKMKNSVIFAFTNVSESPVLFYGDFCMNLYSVDSDEVRQ
jgi:hypothetical protein